MHRVSCESSSSCRPERVLAKKRDHERSFSIGKLRRRSCIGKQRSRRTEVPSYSDVGVGLVGQPCEKTPLSFEFSLCLSRACLGKMIVFIYKWRKRGVFLP